MDSTLEALTREMLPVDYELWEWHMFPLGLSEYAREVAVRLSDFTPHALVTGVDASRVSRSFVDRAVAGGWQTTVITANPGTWDSYVGTTGVTVAVGVGDDSFNAIRRVETLMEHRYSVMEEAETNYFYSLPDPGEWIPQLLIVDDPGSLFPNGLPVCWNDMDGSPRSLAAKALGSVMRLGRAAGVHVVVVSQLAEFSFNAEHMSYLDARVASGVVEVARNLGEAGRVVPKGLHLIPGVCVLRIAGEAVLFRSRTLEESV